MKRTIVDDFSKEMGSLMERFFGEAGPFGGGSFTPATDVAETEWAYEVTIDLPGMNPAEVKVEVQDGQLRISGDRPAAEEVEGKTVHRAERSHGKFLRVIPVFGGVEDEKIDAEYKQGVLHITLPKIEKEKPRQVKVRG